MTDYRPRTECPPRIFWEWYQRGLLSEEEKERIAEHGDSCSHCREVREQIRRWRLRRPRLVRAGLVAGGVLVLATAVAGLAINLTARCFPETTLFAPQVLTPGTTAPFAVHVSRPESGKPVVAARIRLSVETEGGEYALGVVETSRTGAGTLQCLVPDIPPGSGRLAIRAPTGLGSVRSSIPVVIGSPKEILLATDKALYQPGETIHIKSLLRRAGRTARSLPADEEATLEIADALGNKSYRAAKKTSRFGIAAFDFDLASDPRLGEYTIRVSAGADSAERKVRVEQYRLPELRAVVVPDKDSCRVGEQVGITVRAAYSYGKPAAGAEIELTFRAGKQVRQFSARTNEQGRYRLDFAVPREFSDADEIEIGAEIATRGGARASAATRVALAGGHRLYIVPDTQAVASGKRNTFYLVLTDLLGQPIRAVLDVSGPEVGRQRVRTSSYGVASFGLTPRAGPPGEVALVLRIRGELPGGRELDEERTLRLPAVQHLLSVKRTVCRLGEPVLLAVSSTAKSGFALLEIRSHGLPVAYQVIQTETGRADLKLDLPEGSSGLMELCLWQQDASDRRTFRACSKRIYVASEELDLDAEMERPSYRPGETAKLRLRAYGRRRKPTPAAFGVRVADEALLRLAGETGTGNFSAVPDARTLVPCLQAGWRVDVGRILSGETRADQDAAAALLALRTCAAHRPAGEPGIRRAAAARLGLGEQSLLFSNLADQLEHARRLEESFFTGVAVVAISAIALAILWAIIAISRTKGLLRELPDGYEELRAYTTILGSVATSYLVQLLVSVVGVPVALWFVGRRPAPDTQAYLLVLWGCYLLAGILVAGVREHPRGARLMSVFWLVAPFTLYGLSSLEQYRWLETVPAILLAGSFFLAAANVLGVLDVADIFGKREPVWRTRTLVLGGVSVGCFLYLSLLLLGAAFLQESIPESSRLFLGLSALLAYVAPCVAWILLRRSATEKHAMLKRAESFGSTEAVVVAMIIAVLAGTLLPLLARARESYGTTGIEAGSESKSEAVAQPVAALDTSVRGDFPETLYWNPEIISDEHGYAEVSFPLAGSITGWAVDLDAVSATGALGRANLNFRTFKPFFVEASLPARLSVGDEIEVPIRVMNYYARPRDVYLKLRGADWFEPLGRAEQSLRVGPEDETSASFRVRAVRPGRREFVLEASSGHDTDTVARKIAVTPLAARNERALNGTLFGTVRHKIVLPDDASDPQLTVKAYPSALVETVEGLDGLLRTPYGCFEQTSSVAYANVLVLRCLRASDQANPELAGRATKLIGECYQRLLTFEVPSGGFDWYGRGPANAILSAYGVLELSDMAKVYQVDERVITRAVRWLESRQGADGSWHADTAGGTWGNLADRLSETAYVAWALAEAGVNGKSLDKALDYLSARLDGLRDNYALALAANAFFAGGRKSVAHGLVQRLASTATRDGDLVRWESSSTGVTYCRSLSHVAETTALAALALLQDGHRPDMAAGALRYLRSVRGPRGEIGSTQSTILSLKAFLAGSERKIDTVLSVSLNGQKQASVPIGHDSSEALRPIRVRGLRPGPNELVLSEPKESGVPYQALVRYYSKAVPPGEGIEVECEPERTVVAVDEEVPWKLTLRSNGKEPMPMVIAEVELPPGFSVAGVGGGTALDRHEVVGGKLVFYLGGLRPGESVELRYGLRARYVGLFSVRPAEAYAYYCPEVRGRSGAKRIEVR